VIEPRHGSFQASITAFDRFPDVICFGSAKLCQHTANCFGCNPRGNALVLCSESAVGDSTEAASSQDQPIWTDVIARRCRIGYRREKTSKVLTFQIFSENQQDSSPAP
jgi:hypothetical protein